MFLLTALTLAIVGLLAWKFKFIPFGMAALAEDRITETKFQALKSYPVAGSTKIYAGSIVAINSSGYAVPASDSAGLKVVGVAASQADNSTGSNGDKSVKVDAPIIARFDATSITQAMVGQVMYVVDDHTFDDSPGTNGVKAGRLVEFISTTEGWIEIAPSGVGAVKADADATYGQPEADLINELKSIVNKWLLS
jgi:hypothetical protein